MPFVNPLPVRLELVGLARLTFDHAGLTLPHEILDNGWEHHLVMAYGEIAPAFPMLARNLRIPIIIK